MERCRTSTIILPIAVIPPGADRRLSRSSAGTPSFSFQGYQAHTLFGKAFLASKIDGE